MDLSFFSRTLINDPLISNSAVITINGISKNIRVVYSNDYLRSGVMEMGFQGSSPYVTLNCEDADGAEVNESTIVVEGENNNEAFKIREVKNYKPSHSILILSYD
jgi:hypothetical protein